MVVRNSNRVVGSPAKGTEENFLRRKMFFRVTYPPPPIPRAVLFYYVVPMFIVIHNRGCPRRTIRGVVGSPAGEGKEKFEGRKCFFESQTPHPLRGVGLLRCTDAYQDLKYMCPRPDYDRVVGTPAKEIKEIF
jgi:hypothetical protein